MARSSQKVPDNYVLEYQHFDEQKKKTVQMYHDPKAKDLSKAWIAVAVD